MATIPVGLQLYSVRHELEKDVRGTIQAVAEMGYEGVEFFSHLQRPAAELKAMLDEFGLACCGWHIPLDMVQDDKLEESIATMKTLGCTYAIVPWFAAKTRDEWVKFAGFFNELADKLAPHGITAGYHNHDHEFKAIDGETPFDIFFGMTKPEISVQLDTGNGMLGGAEAIPVVEKYAGRSKTIHLKPYCKELGKENPHAGFVALIGQDSTPWKELFDVCATVGGTEWFIVEYESDAIPALEAVQMCLVAVKGILAE